MESDIFKFLGERFDSEHKLEKPKDLRPLNDEAVDKFNGFVKSQESPKIIRCSSEQLYNYKKLLYMGNIDYIELSESLVDPYIDIWLTKSQAYSMVQTLFSSYLGKRARDKWIVISDFGTKFNKNLLSYFIVSMADCGMGGLLYSNDKASDDIGGIAQCTKYQGFFEGE